jgi:hypothetical protein
MRTSIGITLLILFTSACGSTAVQSEDSAPAATGPRIAEPSGTAALTAGTMHYHVTFKSWIPQFLLVDPATGGLPIPYASTLLIENFSNCFNPGLLDPITTVTTTSGSMGATGA